MNIKLIAVLSVLFSLINCATMRNELTVNVTGEQIAQKINEKLALPISLLKVFDINLTNSLVAFNGSTGRMTTIMDTKLSSPLLNKSLFGKLGISGKLRFDAPTSSVVLDEPKIEQLNFVGADNKYIDLFNALTNTVGSDLLNGLTLYTVKPDDLKFGGITYSPKDMIVTDKGLQLTLSPKK